MLFAQADACSILVAVGVMALLGEGILHLTDRMLATRSAVRMCAIIVAVITGIGFFLVGPRPAADATTDPLLGMLITSGLIAAAAGLACYPIIAILTFLFVYLVIVPIQFVTQGKDRSRPAPERDRSGRGWLLSLFLCGSFGFIAGLVHLGWMLQRSPQVGTESGLSVIALWTIGGAVTGLCIRLFISVVRTWLAWNLAASAKKAILKREAEEAYQVQAEKNRHDYAIRRKDATAQKDRDAARQHLADFYAEHIDLLATEYPPALLRAFLLSEMPDTLPAAQLWAICQKKIAEFQPLIAQGRAKKKEEEQRMTRRSIRLKELDSEIRQLQEEITRVQQSGMDGDFIDDETRGLRAEIRTLEAKKELLLALTDVVDV